MDDENREIETSRSTGFGMYDIQMSEEPYDGMFLESNRGCILKDYVLMHV